MRTHKSKEKFLVLKRLGPGVLQVLPTGLPGLRGEMDGEIGRN